MSISTCKNIKQQLGITIIEVSIVLCIISILSVGVTANYRTFIVSHSINQTQFLIFQTLNKIRSLAITQANTVMMCASSDLINCTNESKPNWNNGWIVFVDKNNNKARDTQNEDILFAQEKNSESIIQWNRGRYLSYNYEGKINLNGSFVICSEFSDMDISSRSVIINRVGRMYQSKKNAQNKEIVCG